MQRIANPCTSVRLREAPPQFVITIEIERLKSVGIRWCLTKVSYEHRNPELRALVVELVDTRDLKSLGVRAVPVQVRPGAPSKNAILAQLVERNLAKVEVTSSSLVYRSKHQSPIQKC